MRGLAGAGAEGDAEEEEEPVAEAAAAAAVGGVCGGVEPPTRVRTSLAEHPLTSSRRALCRGGGEAVSMWVTILGVEYAVEPATLAHARGRE